jgi:hypothetical protein
MNKSGNLNVTEFSVLCLSHCQAPDEIKAFIFYNILAGGSQEDMSIEDEDAQIMFDMLINCCHGDMMK